MGKQKYYYVLCNYFDKKFICHLKVYEEVCVLVLHYLGGMWAETFEGHCTGEWFSLDHLTSWLWSFQQLELNFLVISWDIFGPKWQPVPTECRSRMLRSSYFSEPCLGWCDPRFSVGCCRALACPLSPAIPFPSPAREHSLTSDFIPLSVSPTWGLV